MVPPRLIISKDMNLVKKKPSKYGLRLLCILKKEVHRSCALRFITDIIPSKQFICQCRQLCT